MKRLCQFFILCAGLSLGGSGLLSAPAQHKHNDPVAQLQQRLERGEAQLEYAEPGGWLQSVLRALRVPVSSQGLVFSRTSLQSQHISPSNPRAIYFNDQVYIGWIRGAEMIELSAADPDLGGVFYTLEQKPSATPKFVRHESCMRCHGTGNTRFIPGHLVRSVFTEAGGNGLAGFSSFVTDHASPFRERWGGWYVTSARNEERHLGNTFFTEADDPDLLTGNNLISLDKKVDLRGYASPHSDIVALMTLAHQTQMQNLFVWLGYETAMALREQEEISQTTKQPKGHLASVVEHRIQFAVDETLRYLLFTDEAKLRSPIRGTSDFAQEFAAQGLRDRQGRSLRDLDLQERLFRYPCSYLIYSEAFDHIPQPALGLLYRKLWLALTGQAQEKAFRLAEADRRAILEILIETKKNLPDYFRSQISSSN
jgi:hypothetical protein